MAECAHSAGVVGVAKGLLACNNLADTTAVIDLHAVLSVYVAVKVGVHLAGRAHQGSVAGKAGTTWSAHAGMGRQGWPHLTQRPAAGPDSIRQFLGHHGLPRARRDSQSTHHVGLAHPAARPDGQRRRLRADGTARGHHCLGNCPRAEAPRRAGATPSLAQKRWRRQVLMQTSPSCGARFICATARHSQDDDGARPQRKASPQGAD